MNLSPAIPIIRIFSVEKAKEFYLDYLGFSPDWEHRFDEGFPLYAQVRRSGPTLHLSEHHASRESVWQPPAVLRAIQGLGFCLATRGLRGDPDGIHRRHLAA